MHSTFGGTLQAPSARNASRLRPALHLLVGEDNPSDSEILRLAFEKLHRDISLEFVEDGDEVIFYLDRCPPYGDMISYPSPDILLLDLKMPRVDGFQVLSWLRCRARFQSLPTIILSGS